MTLLTQQLPCASAERVSHMREAFRRCDFFAASQSSPQWQRIARLSNSHYLMGHGAGYLPKQGGNGTEQCSFIASFAQELPSTIVAPLIAGANDAPHAVEQLLQAVLPALAVFATQ